MELNHLVFALKLGKAERETLINFLSADKNETTIINFTLRHGSPLLRWQYHSNTEDITELLKSDG